MGNLLGESGRGRSRVRGTERPLHTYHDGQEKQTCTHDTGTSPFGIIWWSAAEPLSRRLEREYEYLIMLADRAASVSRAWIGKFCRRPLDGVGGKRENGFARSFETGRAVIPDRP